jgi:hypothetical protein
VTEMVRSSADPVRVLVLDLDAHVHATAADMICRSAPDGSAA